MCVDNDEVGENSGVTEDKNDSNWGHNIHQFQNVATPVHHNQVVSSDVSAYDSDVEYFRSVFTREMLEIIVNQTNLYATQETSRDNHITKFKLDAYYNRGN